MSNYSIKDLENLSNIKAHTLRIWEKRYNFIKPKRTSTNIRYYDDKDLKLILNISLLKDYGFKISKIAQMKEGEIAREVLKITEKNQRQPEQIHALTTAMIEMDEERFEKVISNSILHSGFEDTILKIVYPFLSKIGVLWQSGSICPAQEHFISNLIRQKLIVAINGQYSGKSEKSFLLFLPEGELHELSLLFANYVLRARGYKVVYLGQSLPFEDLEIVYEIHKPDTIISVFTSKPNNEDITPYIKKLSESFHQSQIILSGYLTKDLNFILPNNVLLFKETEELILHIENGR